MKKLLVPTDFSEPAQRAFSYAIQIALKTNAEINLLNVKPKDAMLDGISGDLEILANNKLTNNKFRNAIENATNSLQNNLWKNIPIHCISSKGDTINEVVNTCTKYQIDLLITANKGNSGWGEKLFGSIAERIIKKVSCPVLAIPKNCFYKDIQQITFATDFSALSQQAIAQIHNFAQMFEAKFNFVHIILEETKSYSKKLANFRLVADEAIGHEQYDIFEIEANGVIEGLNKFIAKNPTDILAMFRHKRSTLNKLFTISYAETMTAYAEIPVLMFSD